jgi:multidrug efflux pump subunit AcrB
MDVQQNFRAGYRDARFQSRLHAIGRAAIHGTILAIAIFYPAAIWKRIVGALLAFFIVGLIVQFRAIRRERR